MISVYDCEFRNPRSRDSPYKTPAYQKLFNTEFDLKGIEKTNCLKKTQDDSTKEQMPIRSTHSTDELTKRLEWTSVSTLGQLLDRKLLPIETTEEERKRLNAITDSDDFNFVPCSPFLGDKQLETTVRIIATQMGLDFVELIKEEYERREKWHRSAIGHTVHALKTSIDEKKRKELQAEQEKKKKEAAKAKKRLEEEMERNRLMAEARKNTAKCFNDSWFGNDYSYKNFCKQKFSHAREQ